MENSNLCAVCGKCYDDSDGKKVSRGLPTFIECSKQRGDNLWQNWLNKDFIMIHEKCRLSYIKKTNVSAAKKRSTSESVAFSSGKSRRISAGEFNFEENCIICGNSCSEDEEKNKKNSKRQAIHQVSNNTNFLQKILSAAEIRDDDDTRRVKTILQPNLNLEELGAKYHGPCYNTFTHKRKSAVKGRPINAEYTAGFEKLCKKIEESDDSQFVLKELADELGDEAPSLKYLKFLLIEKYDDDILFSSRGSDKTILTIRSGGDKILVDNFHNKLRGSEEEQRQQIVKAAANIILEDIQKRPYYETNMYPPADEFMQTIEEDIPATLGTFLDCMTTQKFKDNTPGRKRKMMNIAHAIIACIRPRSFISPILLSLAVYLHRKYASKLLIDIISRLGFSASYKDTLLYEASNVFAEKPILNSDNGTFTQFVFDNADFDTDTLDGKNTFHCMGGIQCVTPASSVPQHEPTPKLPSIPKANEIELKGKMKIVPFQRTSQKSLKDIRIRNLDDLLPDSYETVHLLASELLGTIGKSLAIKGLPGWNGFMELHTPCTSDDTTKIFYLRFIDLPASSYDAINSALTFARLEARKMGQFTVFVTFDQPLYWKAREIIACSSNDSRLAPIVVRLGGFHLLISFLGSIGYIMRGSGLKELWSLIYAAKSTDAMLEGSKYSRALRAHFLTQTCVVMIIIDEIKLSKSMEDDIKKIFNEELKKSSLSDVTSSEAVQTFVSSLKAHLKDVANRGRTAKLWIQYIELVSLIRSYIEAERTGNWKMHLSTIKAMLPFFYSTGHHHYAKSAQLYLQDMIDLEKNMLPAEYQKYTSGGCFTIRRHKKPWSGNWSDMTIEQTLMRSIHVIGGITRREISASVTNNWILSLPASIDVCNALESFVDITAETSEQHKCQHKDMRKANIIRDTSDIDTMITWLEDHPPFPEIKEIMSIATGATGSEKVNCDDARLIGLRLMEEAVDKNFAEIKFPKANKVVNLVSTKSKVKIQGNEVSVDSRFLFQRMIATNPVAEQLMEYFKYELSPYPQSLFTESGLRKSAKKFFDIFQTTKPEYSETGCFIIDGEYLLHTITWSVGTTYADVFQMFVSYIYQYSRDNVIVIFEEEGDPSVDPASSEKYRNSRGYLCEDIFFELTMATTCKPEVMFTNRQNKARFVGMLRTAMENSGFSTKLVTSPSAVGIINTTIEVAVENDSTYIISDNVDHLILLIATIENVNEIFFMKPERKITKGFQLYSINNLIREYGNIRKHLPLIHAFTGYQTTSHIFNIGKGPVVKYFTKNIKKEELKEVIRIFEDPCSTNKNIYSAGEKLFLMLYKRKTTTSLNYERLISYYQAVARKARKKEVALASLPPTTITAQYHSLRVYHQLQLWQDNSKDATLYGWNVADCFLEPIMTSEDPAPPKLLESITCGCTKGCNHGSLCTCRKVGLKCSYACRSCYGTNCTNTSIKITDDNGTNDGEQIEEEENTRKADKDEEDEEEEETVTEYNDNEEIETNSDPFKDFSVSHLAEVQLDEIIDEDNSRPGCSTW